VADLMLAELYPPTHPYHHSAIAAPSDLANISLDDVRLFAEKWFVPNNATLVLVGDFSKDDAARFVEKYFGPIPTGDALPKRRAIGAPSLNGQVRLELAAPVEAPRLSVIWPTAELFRPGDAELDLLARVLTGRRVARLVWQLVDRQKISTKVTAWQFSRA